MMRPFIFYVLFFISNIAYSQEFLKPVTGYFSSWEHQDDYYSSLRKILINVEDRNPVARIIILPSFEPEYILSIDKNKDGVYVLTKRVLSENYDQSSDKSSIRLNEATTIINEELALQIHSRLKANILRARYYEDEYAILDGTEYLFTCFVLGQGLISGRTHSPEEASKMGSMVSLAKGISNLMDESMRESTELSILEELEKLK